MGGTGIVDQFLETFTRYIDSGFGLLGSEVGYLATTLAAIDVTLAGLFWSWGADEDVLARLVKKTLDLFRVWAVWKRSRISRHHASGDRRHAGRPVLVMGSRRRRPGAPRQEDF